MSTAIFRMYLEEGFIIAADGRQTKDPDDQLVSDTTQKIFPLRGVGGPLAYTICGTHLFTSDNCEILWDLGTEATKALGNEELYKAHNLHGFAIQLSRPIQRGLESVRNQIGKLPDKEEKVYSHGTTIAELMLDGFYNGVPSRATIRLFHRDQVLQNPGIYPDRDIRRIDLYGVPEIWSVYADFGNKRLSAFRPKEYNTDVPWTLGQAARIASGYMRACASEEGKAIAPIAHRIIGGRTHIATITKCDGFQWLPGFEPEPHSSTS